MDEINGLFIGRPAGVSNNADERAVKPFVIGRKNWLFANTPRGAKASAIIYSLVETAKANGVNPYEYLQEVLTRLPALETRRLEEELDALLPGPHRCKLPVPPSARTPSDRPPPGLIRRKSLATPAERNGIQARRLNRNVTHYPSARAACPRCDGSNADEGRKIIERSAARGQQRKVSEKVKV